jgi:hypothetical protein
MEKRHHAVVPLRDPIPQLELWAAGNDQLASFAVCGHGGRPLWYSRFSADRGMHPAWKAVPAQTVAATKAIWLAGRARQPGGPATVRLLLHLSDPDVDPQALADVAAKAGVNCHTDVVWGSPALEWCNKPGSAEWREPDLSNLASHRSPHAPFYRGRMAAAGVVAVAVAAAVGVVLAVHHRDGGWANSGSTAASAIMGGLPGPLRAAASSCAQRPADGGIEENCAIKADDPVVRGLLTPGRDSENFAARIEPDPSKTVAQWRRQGENLSFDGATVVRIDDHAPGGSVGVESLNTRSGLDVRLDGFANQRDAADFVGRAGW